MSSEDISWTVSSDYIHHLVKSGQRQDNRKMDEYRPIKLVPGYIPNAFGSALCKIGNTQVVAGVSLVVGTPYPDSPASGVLMTGCELVPMASPEFESGPPRPPAVELARVVDRGIRESHAIEFDKLCIEPKEAVWMVMLDLHVLDYDGNLFDTATLASTCAILNTVMPKYEDGQVIREKTKEKLPVVKSPVECTFVKIGDKIMVDPSLEEDKAMDARVTFATTGGEVLCAAQKGGSGAFTRQELVDTLDMTFVKSKELRKLL
ncbi:MAG: exosome complex protein Rrp42 [Candidatus Diapherotrites archaeon]|nr:exosome complex protein Rrp42 [Candidatus Diapherotrites archaeon]